MFRHWLKAVQIIRHLTISCKVSETSIPWQGMMKSSEDGSAASISLSGMVFLHIIGLFLLWLRPWLIIIFRECLVNEGHILEESTTESWSKIYDQAKDLLGFRYRASLEQAVNDIQRFLDEFEKDNLSATFMQAFKQLVCDLRREGQSRFALKRPLLQDLKGVILPALAKHIQVIPIPRIEVSKSFYNLVSFFPSTSLIFGD